MITVYKIENILDGKFYLGSTNDHLKRYGLGFCIEKHHNIYLRRAVKKYGKAYFTHSVISTHNTYDEALLCEQWWLVYYKHFGDWNVLYNISTSATGGSGTMNGKSSYEYWLEVYGKEEADKRNKILKQKQSDAAKGENNYFYGRDTRGEKNSMWGKHPSIETKQKISASNRGKKHTAETKTKMSIASKGKKKSAEHCAKLSAAGRGRVVSDETKKKLSDANRGKTGEKNHMYGKKLSIETKKKIGDACRGEKNGMYGKTFSAEAKAKMSDARKKYWERKRNELQYTDLQLRHSENGKR